MSPQAKKSFDMTRATDDTFHVDKEKFDPLLTGAQWRNQRGHRDSTAGVSLSPIK